MASRVFENRLDSCPAGSLPVRALRMRAVICFQSAIRCEHSSSHAPVLPAVPLTFSFYHFGQPRLSATAPALPRGSRTCRALPRLVELRTSTEKCSLPTLRSAAKLGARRIGVSSSRRRKCLRQLSSRPFSLRLLEQKLAEPKCSRESLEQIVQSVFLSFVACQP